MVARRIRFTTELSKRLAEPFACSIITSHETVVTLERGSVIMMWCVRRVSVRLMGGASDVSTASQIEDPTGAWDTDQLENIEKA